MEDKVNLGRDCGECAYFSNGPKHDWCSLSEEPAECCDMACADFEEAE